MSSEQMTYIYPDVITTENEVISWLKTRLVAVGGEFIDDYLHGNGGFPSYCRKLSRRIRELDSNCPKYVLVEDSLVTKSHYKLHYKEYRKNVKKPIYYPPFISAENYLSWLEETYTELTGEPIPETAGKGKKRIKWLNKTILTLSTDYPGYGTYTFKNTKVVVSNAYFGAWLNNTRSWGRLSNMEARRAVLGLCAGY